MTLTIPQRNSLVQEYLWCIDSVIKQNYSLLKAAHLDRDDVYQSLAMRLIRAVELYDPENEAGKSLKGYIFMSLRFALHGTGRARREAVYYINTIPGEAMARKGHADFPEDFPHLRPGENFTAWRVGYDWEVETTLSGESLLARLKALKDQAAEERTRELQYIISFAGQGCFDAELACNQLRSLWTAYCLHHDLDVDISGYDNDLTTVWAQVAAVEDDTACWSDYSSFGSFMCAHLV